MEEVVVVDVEVLVEVVDVDEVVVVEVVEESDENLSWISSPDFFMALSISSMALSITSISLLIASLSKVKMYKL